MRLHDVNESEEMQAGYQDDGDGKASGDIAEDWKESEGMQTRCPDEAGDWKASGDSVEDRKESVDVQARLERLRRYADLRLDRLPTCQNTIDTASDAA